MRMRPTWPPACGSHKRLPCRALNCLSLHLTKALGTLMELRTPILPPPGRSARTTGRPMGRDPNRRLLLAGLGITGAAALVRVAQARPPPSPSSGTSLRDVYNKVPRTDQGLGEARIPVDSLPRSATALYGIDTPGGHLLPANRGAVARQA